MIRQHWVYTQYRTSLVSTNDPLSCNNQPAYQAIQVDGAVHQIAVVATGGTLLAIVISEFFFISVNLLLAVTDPDGNFPEAELVFQINDTYVW